MFWYLDNEFCPSLSVARCSTFGTGKDLGFVRFHPLVRNLYMLHSTHSHGSMPPMDRNRIRGDGHILMIMVHPSHGPRTHQWNVRLMEMHHVRGEITRLLRSLAPSLDNPTRCYPYWLLPWLVNPLARIIPSLSLGLLGGLNILIECSMANAES